VLKLEDLPWSLKSSVIIHLVSDTTVRLFFIRGVWFLGNKNVAVTGVLSLLTILSAVFVIMLEAKTFALNNVTALLSSNWEIYTSLSLVTCTDLLIASALCFYLYRSRHSGYKATNSILARLCLYAISTGLLTSFWSLASLTAFAKDPDSFLYLAFYLPQSKLYVNAFLASLNARGALREKVASTGVAASPSQNIVGLSTMGFRRPHSETSTDFTEPEAPVISIHIEDVSLSTDDIRKANLDQPVQQC